eukprot:Clim_evm2s170 gene=Clim_evmTU2s170
MGFKADLRELYASSANVYLRWLVALIIALSFFHDFKNSEAYITPYLKQDKGFDSNTITNEFYPVSTYGQLVFLPVVGVAAEFFGYDVVILVCMGAAPLAGRTLLLYGTEVIHMQLMQAMVALANAGDVALTTLLYRFFPHHVFQTLTGLVSASGNSSHLLGSLLGQLLVSAAHVDLVVVMYVSLGSISIASSIALTIFILMRSTGMYKMVQPPSAAAPGISLRNKDGKKVEVNSSIESIGLRGTPRSECDADLARYADIESGRSGSKERPPVKHPARMKQHASASQEMEKGHVMNLYGADDGKITTVASEHKSIKQMLREFWVTLRTCYSSVYNSMWCINWSLTSLTLTLAEKYGNVVWSDRDPEFELYGAISCAAWGLGALTGLLPGVFGERLLRPSVTVCIGILQLVAAIMLFLQAYIPVPAVYLTAYIVFSGISYFLLAHFAAGIAILMQRKGLTDYAWIFAVNTFVSVGLKTVLETVDKEKHVNAYGRFVGYGWIQVGIAALTFASALWGRLGPQSQERKASSSSSQAEGEVCTSSDLGQNERRSSSDLEEGELRSTSSTSL